LKALSVMRIWKRERDPRKRLKLVAEVCGYKGCRNETAAHKQRSYMGHATEPMSKSAVVEMSKTRTKARTFFQHLFPWGNPANY
jgi:hypothetical protein